MKFISHRGNVDGRIPEMENRPDYILQAICEGYDVEIDVRYFSESMPNFRRGWYLGHDEAQYPVPESFLNNSHFWIHAKNVDAAFQLLRIKENINFFWHNSDQLTFTSKGYIWTCDLSILDTSSPELRRVVHMITDDNYENITPVGIAGICSDMISTIRDEWENQNVDVPSKVVIPIEISEDNY